MIESVGRLDCTARIKWQLKWRYCFPIFQYRFCRCCWCCVWIFCATQLKIHSSISWQRCHQVESLKFKHFEMIFKLCQPLTMFDFLLSVLSVAFGSLPFSENKCSMPKHFKATITPDDLFMNEWINAGCLCMCIKEDEAENFNRKHVKNWMIMFPCFLFVFLDFFVVSGTEPVVILSLKPWDIRSTDVSCQ